MANVIKPKRSNTASAVPTTGQITGGEMAVNMADRKIWINNGTQVVQIGAGNVSALGDVSITSPNNGEVLKFNSSTAKWENSSVSATNATNITGGTANQIPYQTAVSTTGFITAPTTTNTYLKWTGSAFSWDSVSSADSLTTTRTIYGNSFNGTQDLTQVIASTYGGTGNGFTKFSGPNASEKTFSLPNSSATILTSANAVTIAQGGTGQTAKTAAFDALSPLTTKGDLVVFDGTNNIRLPKGSDNLYLAADSTTSTGLAWKSTLTDPVVYTANSLTLTNGVYVSGSVTDIQTYNDGNFYQITDGTGAGPAWIIAITFTSVVSFNRLVANVDYTVNSGHTVYFQIYNNTTLAWDNLGSYSGSSGYTQYALAVLNDTPYISSGTVLTRIYHSNAGSATHTTKLDYVALEQTTTGSQGPRGATGATGTTGAGVPVGGTVGQYLRKNSTTDYDTSWSSASIPQTVSAAVTAGTNAQGQGLLTSDLNIVTTTASAPSAVTLPVATVGRTIRIVNKGTNIVNVYPNTGEQIDALGANIPYDLPVNSVIEFDASTTTQWYSSGNVDITRFGSTFINEFTTTATAGGTTALTADSSYYQEFTGTLTQTITMPSTATLVVGLVYEIINNSTGTLTVQTSTAVSLGTIPTGMSARLIVLTTGSNAATAWDFGYTNFGTITGTGSAVLGTSPTITTPAITGGTIDNTVIGGTTPVAGSFTTITSTSAPAGNTSGVLTLTGTPNAAAGGRAGVLQVGPTLGAADKNLIAVFGQSINDYTQVVIQNTNAGSAASADLVINNNNTSGQGTYIDLGINSSAYTGTGSGNLANAGYLTTFGGDLVLGTDTANAIHFVVNAGTTDAATISSAGVLSLGTALAISSGGTGVTTAPAAYAAWLGFTTTATAGGTTTLTNTSSVYQVFTGTLNQTVQLPATSTLTPGWSYHIVNNSTGTLTLNTSTSVTLGTIPPGMTVMPTALTNSGNTATDWEFGYSDFSTITGTGSNVLGTAPTISRLSLAAGTATANTAPLKFTSGTNLSVVEAGAVEYDGTKSYITTGETGSGRSVLDNAYYFYTTGAGGAIGATIADIFTAAAFTMQAGGTYIFEWHIYLTKNTAGTVTFTVTTTQTPQAVTAGYGNHASALTASTAATGATTTTALPASASLANNAVAYFPVRAVITANATTGGTARLQVTAGAGSVTVQRGSHVIVRRLPAANTGSFA